MRALAICACAGGLALLAGAAAPARAAELSDKSVSVLMNYAWAILPNKFTTPQGKVIEVDKSKRDAVIVPIEVARDVVKVARLSAHAQICKLSDKQVENYRTMMSREEAKKAGDKAQWSDQQLLYISQLHLFTVMWLTGNVKIVEKDGEKEVVVDEGGGESAEQTCTDEQRKAVEQQIDAYVKAAG
jgi:hypothetical protein